MNKNPFQVYILWHKEFKDGVELASYLFRKLNRDPDNINYIDIGIPVHFRNMTHDEEDIQYNSSEKTVVVILIDDNMVVDERWEEYITQIINEQNSRGNVLIYPVAINDNSFCFHDKLQGKNFIRMMDIEQWEAVFKGTENLKDNVDFKKEFLLSELTHEFSCELYNSQSAGGREPLKLFLSHTKSDGVEVTKTLKRYIEAFSKSKTFFDANDIEIGQEFWERIEGNIENSFLVIIHSDKYTNSAWCRKEVLSAKKYNRPIIEINAIEKEEIRSFPYMANIRTIRLMVKSSFIEYYHVITEIYREALRHKYNELKIQAFISKENMIAKVLINRPELLNFHNGNIEDDDTIIYPDPPLSKEELDLLDKNKSYFTPLTYYAINKRLLENKKISFSISEASDEQKDLKFYALKDIMCELIRYILYFGGSIYYGGDLKYNSSGNFNLLKTMIDVLDMYKKINENLKDIQIYNFVAYPLTETISVSDRAKYRNLIKFQLSIPNGYPTGLGSDELKDIFNITSLEHLRKWVQSLTEMRTNLINEIDAVIIMGGKVTGYKGKYPGILEEFLIASNLKKPIYILGGFGGASKEIIQLVKGGDSKVFEEKEQFKENNSFYMEMYKKDVDIKYSDICKRIKDNGYLQLNNGLTQDENDILFSSEDAQEIIGLIIKGLLIRFAEDKV